MPQTKFQDVVFTAIMATLMVYGMICYNIALTGQAPGGMVFLEAFRELPIMAPIAFALEFVIVGKLAKAIAFKFVNPRKHAPVIIIIAISTCICCIMCPIMSAIATLMFNSDPSMAAFARIFVANIPMALSYQLLFCGPVVRRVFGLIFRSQLAME